jgi:hypothetical protein
VSHGACLSNLEVIRKHGLQPWLKEQGTRRRLLEQLLAHYNEGRSASFYGVATTLLSPEVIAGALEEAQRRMGTARIGGEDIKTRAKIVRTALQERATAAGIDLRLRHQAKET